MRHLVGVDHLLDPVGGLVDDLGVLHDDHVGIEIHGGGEHHADAHLAHNLVLAGDAVLVVLLYLLVVVEKSERAEPQCGEQHQQHVDIRQVAHQQTGDDDGDDDDDAAHGGCAGLLGLALEVEVAHDLAHLHQLQAVDDTTAHKYRDKHGQHEGQPAAHGHVAHQAGAGHTVEIIKEVV